MQTPCVVERLDVSEEIDTCSSARRAGHLMYGFSFERSKEALHRGAVGPSTDTVHADLASVCFQVSLVGLCGHPGIEWNDWSQEAR